MRGVAISTLLIYPQNYPKATGVSLVASYEAEAEHRCKRRRTLFFASSTCENISNADAHRLPFRGER